MSELRKEIEEIVNNLERRFDYIWLNTISKYRDIEVKDEINRAATALEELFEQKIKEAVAHQELEDFTRYRKEFEQKIEPLLKVWEAHKDYNMDMPNLAIQNILWQAIQQVVGEKDLKKRFTNEQLDKLVEKIKGS